MNFYLHIKIPFRRTFQPRCLAMCYFPINFIFSSFLFVGCCSLLILAQILTTLPPRFLLELLLLVHIRNRNVTKMFISHYPVKKGISLDISWFQTIGHSMFSAAVNQSGTLRSHRSSSTVKTRRGYVWEFFWKRWQMQRFVAHTVTFKAPLCLMNVVCAFLVFICPFFNIRSGFRQLPSSSKSNSFYTSQSSKWILRLQTCCRGVIVPYYRYCFIPNL